MAGKKLPKIDFNKLTAAQVDKMSHEALREAVRSVIRDPGGAAMHKDHRSHSSSDSQILTDRVRTAGLRARATVKPGAVKPGAKKR